MKTTIKLVTPPTVMPVTLAEAKLHLRVDHSDEDTLISAYIAAATGTFEERAARALILQSWQLALDEFEDAIEFPNPPLSSVDLVTYLDSAGAQQTLAATEYMIFNYGRFGHLLLPASGKSWPATTGQVRVNYTAGYGASGSDVPADIRAWIMLAIGTMYANREQTSLEPTASLPDNFWDSLITPYKQMTA